MLWATQGCSQDLQRVEGEKEEEDREEDREKGKEQEEKRGEGRRGGGGRGGQYPDRSSEEPRPGGGGQKGTTPHPFSDPCLQPPKAEARAPLVMLWATQAAQA